MRYNSRTITLTTPVVTRYSRAKNTCVYDERATEKRARALATLLGGYNKYGSSIDIETFEAIRAEFEDSIAKVAALLA